MFLATKFCTADGHLPPETPVPEIIAAVESSLGRLQTDYVDLVHIHSCDRVERLLAPNFHEAFDRLKEQGKARFLGFSSHTPRLEEVAHAAIASNRFDVMMLAYHHGLFPGLNDVIDQAHAKDIGVVAMKTLKGAKAENFGMRDEAVAYSQAAFRWVLANPAVACLVISFTKLEHCDEYLFASGTPVRDAHHPLLQRYDRLASADYCRPHCGQLPIARSGRPADRYRAALRHVLRTTASDRAREARPPGAGEARTRAAVRLPAPARTCPYEPPIRAKMVRAHGLRSLSGASAGRGRRSPCRSSFGRRSRASATETPSAFAAGRPPPAPARKPIRARSFAQRSQRAKNWDREAPHAENLDAAQGWSCGARDAARCGSGRSRGAQQDSEKPVPDVYGPKYCVAGISEGSEVHQPDGSEPRGRRGGAVLRVQGGAAGQGRGPDQDQPGQQDQVRPARVQGGHGGRPEVQALHRRVIGDPPRRS
jgi:diketogulonate reductase-like aldo/keto reductase